MDTHNLNAKARRPAEKLQCTLFFFYISRPKLVSPGSSNRGEKSNLSHLSVSFCFPLLLHSMHPNQGQQRAGCCMSVSCNTTRRPTGWQQAWRCETSPVGGGLQSGLSTSQTAADIMSEGKRWLMRCGSQSAHRGAGERKKRMKD